MFYHALIFIIVINYSMAMEDPVISTSDGIIRGKTGKTIKYQIKYYAFKGIPFAKKPIGNLRFEPPVKVDPWKGVLNATEDKDKCTQLDSKTGALVGSEDCLYLSVYTTCKLKKNQSLLPVMIYIYGGSFQSGSSSYDDFAPDYLLEKGVVYIGMNYRLGIYGFLSTEDMVVPGNVGLKDQILAIQWVKNNIKNFGGDPNRITVFGQSAGAVSVSYLLQSHLTEGFFKQAIMESGTSLCVWALTFNNREKAFKVAKLLGINATDTQTLVDKLRNVSYIDLKYAENQITLQETVANSLTGLPFGVVQEPEHPGAVFSIKSKSHLQLAQGKFPKIPILLGFTSNEAAFYQDQLALFSSTLASYDANVSRLAPPGIVKNPIKKKIVGSIIKEKYFGNETIASQGLKFIPFFTVYGFKRPIRETACLLSLYTKIFLYQFSYRGNLGNSNRTYTGVAHEEDIKYIFVQKNINATVEDMQTVERMTTLWTNFAKTGNPTPSNIRDVNIGDVIWHPTKSCIGDNILYLNINNTLRLHSNPFQSDWIFYQKIAWEFGDRPFTTY